MWRIKILYKDFSEITFKGIEVDIDYQTAIFYYNNYIAGKDVSTATYQQYPINEHKRYNFAEKIELLRQADLASHRLQMTPNKLGPGRVVKYELDVFVSEEDSPVFNLELISKAVEDSGFVVLNSSYDSDVTCEYVKEHPGLVWKKVLETNDAIYYLRNNTADDKVKKYSKIGCREYSGNSVVTELQELLKSVSSNVVTPLFINKEALIDFLREEGYTINI